MHVLVVDALPVELLQVEIEDSPNVIVRVVSRLVLNSLLAFDPDDCPRKVLLIRVILGVIHRAVEACGRLGLWLWLRGRGRGRSLPCLLLRGNGRLVLRNNASGVLNVGPGAVTGLLVNVFAFGDVLEENLWDDGLLGGSLMGGSTRRMRLAQGIKPVAPLGHEVFAVAQ
jgi:hypothetical protein